MSEACNIDRIVLFRVPRYKDPGEGLFQRRGTPIVYSPITIRLGRCGISWRLDEFVSSVALARQMNDKLRWAGSYQRDGGHGGSEGYGPLFFQVDDFLSWYEWDFVAVGGRPMNCLGRHRERTSK